MKQNIIKSILFLVILFFLFWGLSAYFAHKKIIGRNNISIMGIAGEKVDAIDYFVLGDSETYTSIIPLEIWHKEGYTGYVLGTPAQRLKETKEMLLNNLVNQKPKLVILETNAVFRKDKNRKTKESFNSIFVDLYKYHDNWKYFVDENFQIYSGNEKGYMYSIKVKKAPKGYDIVETDRRATIPLENYSYIEEIIKICNENNIKIVLLSVPSVKNWNYEKHNSLVDLANKYNLLFIDLNLDENISINWNNDTQDKGDHLNYYGALKVTDRLSEHLKNLNILTDHRNDSNYDYWNISYKKYMLKFSEE